VNDPELDPDRRFRLSRLPSPEIVGSGFAVVVVGIVLSAALGGGPARPGAPASPRPVLSFQPATETPKPPVDPVAVELLRSVNERLAGYEEILRRELDRTTLQTSEVRSTITQVNSTAAYGVTAVAALDGAQGPDEVGGQMAEVYRSIEASAQETLGASVLNEPAHRVGGDQLARLIAGLPALQAELEALLLAPSPSASPTADPSAASAPPTTPPSAAPPASASPPPLGSQPAPPSATPSVVPGSPEPTPAPGEELENGGFENGVGVPWALFVAPGSDATIMAETSAPFAGTTAARIDIPTPGLSFSGVSLRQLDVALEGGRSYTLSMLVRSDAPREVRIRIGSPVGGSYFFRSFMVGPAWTNQTYPFIAPLTTPSAMFQIELGRSNVTTWIDSVSLRPTSP
jgi:hypothetical protein